MQSPAKVRLRKHFENMKFLSVVIVCAAICYTQAVKLNEENARAVAGECMQKTGTTEMDVMDMFAHKPATNDKAKCMRACVLHKLDITDHTGKFNKTGALDSLSFFARGDPATMDKIKELVENCSVNKVSADSCQAGDESLQCIFMWGSKLNISLEY